MPEDQTESRQRLQDEVARLRAENARLREHSERLERAEREARKSQADLLALIENTDDCVLFSDAEGKPVVFNSSYARTMKRLLGMDMAPGMQPHTRLDEQGRAFWDGLHRRVLAGERFKAEFDFPHDGEVLCFEVSFNPVYDDGRVVGFSEYTRNITERQRVERQLQSARRQSEEDYQRLFDEMLDGVAVHEIICDDRGKPIDYRFLAVNPAFEAQTGKSAHEIVGRSVREALPGTESHWIETYGRVALTGVPTRFESYSGVLERHYEVAAFRPRENQFACIFQDITDRKRLEEQQSRAERLESLGVLAGGIAHDFNNILASLLVSVQMAAKTLDPDGVAAARLAESEKACLRASELTRQLLTFARGGAPVKERGFIGDALRDWAEFALRGSNVSSELSVATDLWPVESDRGQISQVIHNLVLNADQAMPEGGVVRVSAENVQVEAGSCLAEAVQRPGRYVQITVSDQGVGIASEHLPRIFDPYFTTKQRGSGLGLATSYSIVNNHGGVIRVCSTVGQGSTFEILLPAAAHDDGAANPQQALLDGGGGRVLLMDDDEQLRQMARLVLEDIGYEVDVVSEGAEAVRLYRAALSSERPYAAVILDLTVPGGLGGAGALQQLREIDPEVKAIVSSGYSINSIMASYAEHGFKGVVAKPYLVQELAQALARVIGGD